VNKPSERCLAVKFIENSSLLATILCSRSSLEGVRRVANISHQSISTRIIVADSHTLFRGTLSALLNQHRGWEVVAEAADGRGAAQCCHRFNPDLLVMDVRMPEVDGLEAIRAIKSASPSTAVLVLNGYGEDPILMAEALEAGASGYILKSATPQEITDAVAKALVGASTVDQDVAAEALLRLLGKPQMQPSSSLSPDGPHGGEQLPPTLPASLTPREVEVLRLVAQGCTNRPIAQSLFISVSTVKKHVQRTITKLGLSTRTEAAVKASGLGLLDFR
jgi:DNA-binding NarL/FixJ family response regulator